MVNIGRIAAQASRTVYVGEVATGVFSGLLLASDIFFIAMDAREICNIKKQGQMREVYLLHVQCLKLVTPCQSLMIPHHCQARWCKTLTLDPAQKSSLPHNKLKSNVSSWNSSYQWGRQQMTWNKSWMSWKQKLHLFLYFQKSAVIE